MYRQSKTKHTIKAPLIYKPRREDGYASDRKREISPYKGSLGQKHPQPSMYTHIIQTP
jgi:hypothetical protein